MPLNGRMDTENVTHLHMEYYSAGCGVPNGGVGGWSRGAEGVYSSMERTVMSATQMPQKSQGLNDYPSGTHGSS